MLTASDFADVTTAPAEQRHERRLACDRVIDVLTCSTPANQLRVDLVDCSLGGLCFVAANPMPRGEQILVKLMLGGDVRILMYTVRRCTPRQRGRFAVEAAFTGYVAVPAEDELKRVLGELLGREHPDLIEG